MRLDSTKFKDTVIGAESEQQFEIDGNSPVIFEILRDKMYTNKIAAVCREVSSNSRDANREAGQEDSPITIEIVKPNAFLSVSDMSIMFYDKGPGITPDRMSNIYLKYAASTKRDSNQQTGGFGLGAKTPFAYSDTFTVITVCDIPKPIEGSDCGEVSLDEVVRMKYEYTAMIDSTRKGKMICFDSEETTESCGTKVIVPISESDRGSFELECYKATSFWKIQPEFLNFSTDKPQFQLTPIEGCEVNMLTGNGLSEIGMDNVGCVASIDGIPYPIHLHELGLNFNFEQSSFLVDIPVGTLTISANREQVQYDEITVDYLKSRVSIAIEKAADSLKKLIFKEVQNCSSLINAQKTVNSITSEYQSDCSDELKGLNSIFRNLKNQGHLKSFKVPFEGSELRRRTKYSLSFHKIQKVEFCTWSEKWKYSDLPNGIDLSKGKAVFEGSKNGEIVSNSKLYFTDIRKNGRRNVNAFSDNKGVLYLITPFRSTIDKKTYQEDDFYRKSIDKQIAEQIELCRWFNVEMYSDLEIAESDGSVKTKGPQIPYYKRLEIGVKIKTFDQSGELKSDVINYDKKLKKLNLTEDTSYLMIRADKLTNYRTRTPTGGWSPKGTAATDERRVKQLNNFYKKEGSSLKYKIIVVADKQAKYFQNNPQVKSFDLHFTEVNDFIKKQLLRRKELYIKHKLSEKIELTDVSEVNQIFLEEYPLLNQYLVKRNSNTVALINEFSDFLSNLENRDLKKKIQTEIESRSVNLNKLLEVIRKENSSLLSFIRKIWSGEFKYYENIIKSSIKETAQKTFTQKMRPYRMNRKCVFNKRRVV